MQGGNQRRQLVLFHVLQLVDEHRSGGTGPLGGDAYGLQQGGQILFQVSVVCESCLRIEVETNLDVEVL